MSTTNYENIASDCQSSSEKLRFGLAKLNLLMPYFILYISAHVLPPRKPGRPRTRNDYLAAPSGEQYLIVCDFLKFANLCHH